MFWGCMTLEGRGGLIQKSKKVAQEQQIQEKQEKEQKAQQTEQKERGQMEEEKQKEEERRKKEVQEQEVREKERRVQEEKEVLRRKELLEEAERKRRERVTNLAGQGGEKVVALTFDDGPSRATTGRLLDILREKQVKATFFVLGVMARNAPDLVKREVAEGHEVQGHTMAHKSLARMSEEEIKADARAADDLMIEIMGYPPQLIRPPYGEVNQIIKRAIGRPLVCWDVDPLDWKYRNAETVRTNVLAGIHNGAVVILHDIHMTTVAAVPKIIEDLREAGYKFVTVSELAAIKQVKLEKGKAYWGI